jgi:hypothetical protein
MPAAGKTNASRVQINERIIVQVVTFADGTTGLFPSVNKTGEGVHVARVTGKTFGLSNVYRNNRYTVETTSGTFDAAPIQTMWLAPEDAAGVKRAHVEALEIEQSRTVAEAVALAEVVAEEIKAAHEAGTIGTQQFQALTMTHDAAVRCTRPSYGQGTAGRLALRHLADIRAEIALTLTLHSQDGKVDTNSTDDLEETEMTAFPNDNREPAEGEQAMNATPAEPVNHTGSTVVKVLEKVWSRIRANHPELPEVVIITGSGEGTKWGHFRAESWKVRAEEGAAVSGEPGRRHELFLASEALAKGPTQVLQTMIHEAAHTISRVRGIKDTSRQGRWHNAEFKKAAAELGLEHKSSTADKSHGFSFVTLTTATKERYADLIAELETEIKLTGLLPLWMGGSDQEDERGGERITGKPTKGGEAGGAKSGPMKATCACAEPVIIRLSQKVLDMGVVRCDGCESLFTAA